MCCVYNRRETRTDALASFIIILRLKSFTIIRKYTEHSEVNTKCILTSDCERQIKRIVATRKIHLNIVFRIKKSNFVNFQQKCTQSHIQSTITTIRVFRPNHGTVSLSYLIYKIYSFNLCTIVKHSYILFLLILSLWIEGIRTITKIQSNTN